jgi:hypothetical protein
MPGVAAAAASGAAGAAAGAAAQKIFNKEKLDKDGNVVEKSFVERMAAQVRFGLGAFKTTLRTLPHLSRSSPELLHRVRTL